MAPSPASPWRAFRQLLLIGGLLAGALTGCGVRQRRQAAETATAAAQATSGLSNPTLAPATATPDDDQANALDAELEALNTELSDADTLDDLETDIPPDEAPATPAAESAATATPAPEATTGVGETDQGAEIEQLLDALQNSLDQTDTVAEAANP